jgi:uncharacterized repeat protein (TIGR01451 family)
MWFNELCRRWFGRVRPFPVRVQQRCKSRRRPIARPRLEALEARMLLSGGLPFPTPSNASQLVQDISYADNNPGTYTIALASSTAYVLDSTTGPMPEIAANVNLTIVGQGATIERSSTAAAFRLFDVTGGGSLTLQNLKLTGGLAEGTGTAAEGGAIFSSGTLKLSGVTVESNEALGSTGRNINFSNAFGGGLYVAGGSVSLTGDTLSGNQARGGHGAYGGNPSGSNIRGLPGGIGNNGAGGGLYVAAGSVSLTNDTLSGNQALGGTGGYGGFGERYAGNGGIGGNGTGGGLFLAAGSATLTNDTLSGNQALGGMGGSGGSAVGTPGIGGIGGNGTGGGLYLAAGSATLTNDTLSGNQALGGTGGTGGHSVVQYGGNGGNGGNSTGGGLYIAFDSDTTPANTGVVTLANTLIAENKSTGGTAGQGGYSDTYTPLGKSGAAGSTSDPDVSGTVTSSDHDLIGDGSGSNLSNGDSGGDLVGYTASQLNLGPLANNGGPTQTLALLPGSPAIDAGDSNAPGLPSTDQRGYARIFGNAVDIGAVEYRYDLSITGSAPTSVQAGQPIAYTLTVTNNGPDMAGNGGGVTLTDVLPGGVTFVSAQSAGWTLQNGIATATIPALASGASANFTLTVQANSASDTIGNTVSVGPTTWDTNSTNNSVSFTTTITQVATTIAGTASPASFGQAVTLTANVAAVAPSTAIPVGSVDFFDTTTQTDLGSVNLSGGTAQLVTSSPLPAGTQIIALTYGGNADFIGSSTTVTVSVLPSLYVLNTTASGALTVSGNANINVPGAVQVDSDSKTALVASGNAQLTSSTIDVSGGYQKIGHASFSVTPTTGLSEPDPLAGVAPPSTSGLANNGSVNLSGNSSLTINPGIYSQILVSGNAALTMNPGIYVIEGGGMTVSGKASVSGTGVLIYNASGGITFSGNATIDLSAATTGLYAGIVIFQARGNDQVITVSGNANASLTGAICAANAQLILSGNAQLVASSLVVGTMLADGNSRFNEEVG